MKTIPYLLALLPLFLLTTLIGFSQENNESKTVKLHLPNTTDLVHFQEGDYILSFHRNDLFGPFVNDDSTCIQIPSAADTLDFSTVAERIGELCGADGFIDRFEFEQAFERNLRMGNVHIHSITTGKDLSQVRYSENKTDSLRNCRYKWILEDPSNDAPIYGIRSFRVIAMPNF